MEKRLVLGANMGEWKCFLNLKTHSAKRQHFFPVNQKKSLEIDTFSHILFDI